MLHGIWGSLRAPQQLQRHLQIWVLWLRRRGLRHLCGVSHPCQRRMLPVGALTQNTEQRSGQGGQREAAARQGEVWLPSGRPVTQHTHELREVV